MIPSLRPRRRSVPAWLVLAGVLMAPTAAAGQDLEPTPLRVESLGLSFHPPAGAAVRFEESQGTTSIVLVDSSSAPIWTIRITRLVSTLDRPTAGAQIDDHLRRMRDRGESFEVIENAPSRHGQRNSQNCYINQTLGDQQVVSGWLVLPTGERDFLVFSLVTTPEFLASVRPVVEASYATIRVLDTEQVVAAQLSRLQAGAALLNSLSDADLRRLVGMTQWARIYRPGPDGAAETEVGYSLIEVREGKRGLLNPERVEKNYSPTEHQIGLLVRVQGRVVVNPVRNDYYDSIALYWLAWDQSEETWSIRATRRMGEAERTEAETGVRIAPSTGSPVPRLTVIKGDDSSRERETTDWEVPESYLSQALGWVLGPLLAKRATADGEFGFAFYSLAGGEPGLTERIDQWQKRTDGTFDLITRLQPDASPYSSVYRPDGTLARRTREDGTLTVPADPESIRRLWEAKGLRFGR